MGIAADDSRNGEWQSRTSMTVWHVLSTVFFRTFGKDAHMMAVSALDRLIDGVWATAFRCRSVPRPLQRRFGNR